MPSSAESNDRFYRKVKAVCCEAWGVTPHAFDVMADAGEIAFSDIQDLIELKAHMPFLGEGYITYLFGTRIAEQKKKSQNLAMLGQQLRLAKDPEKRERILQAIKDLDRDW